MLLRWVQDCYSDAPFTLNPARQRRSLSWNVRPDNGGALMTRESKRRGCVLVDWGGTLMRDFPEFAGPMAAWPRVETTPHAQDALAALRSRGWALALATNAADSDEAAIWVALRRGGLGESLDRVYCFRNVGHKKPSAGFFEFILQDLRLQRADVVMVGDDYEADVLGANAAGIRAVWFSEGREEERTGEMHRTVHDLAFLPQVLELWEV